MFGVAHGQFAVSCPSCTRMRGSSKPYFISHLSTPPASMQNIVPLQLHCIIAPSIQVIGRTAVEPHCLDDTAFVVLAQAIFHLCIVRGFMKTVHEDREALMKMRALAHFLWVFPVWRQSYGVLKLDVVYELGIHWWRSNRIPHADCSLGMRQSIYEVARFPT